jgi:hypothetical protein
MKYFNRMKTLAAVLPLLRDLKTSRRPPRVEHGVFHTASTDGVDLFCTLLGRNPEKAVVVAHPAVVGGYYVDVVALAEVLSGSFSVVLFDFRGHGRSTGRCPLGFLKVSEDLEAVVERVRGMGFKQIGVAGFSLGAAAAMLLASRDNHFNALVSIGCPPRMPEIPLVTRHRHLSAAGARVLGMRLEPISDTGPSPIDVAEHLPGFPKLLIFGEWEVVPQEEISEFTELVSGPKTVLTVPGAWHADLMGREGLVKHWFEENM